MRGGKRAQCRGPLGRGCDGKVSKPEASIRFSLLRGREPLGSRAQSQPAVQVTLSPGQKRRENPGTEVAEGPWRNGGIFKLSLWGKF